jgi:iron complex outermembrane recepter protein
MGADHGLEIDQYEPERVEIKKGPSSLLYGSDAMGGVINILPPSLPQENTLSGSFLGAYKSLNNLYATSTMVEGNRNGIVSRVRFSSQDYGDYRVPADTFVYNRFVLPIYNQRLKNTAGQERNLTAMAGISKNWGYTTITLSNFNQRAGLFPGALGIPREYQLTDDGDPRNIDIPRQVTNHFKVIANANILFKQNWLELDLGYQQNIRREESNPHAHGRGPAPEGILALGLNLQTYSMNIKYHQQINGRMRTIYGIQSDYQLNRRSGFEFLLSDYTAGSIGSFIYQEFDFNSTFTFNGGIRYDYGYRNIDGYSEPVYADPETIIGHNTRTGNFNRNFRNFSGATGISWYPSHEFNAKLNLGSSFRMPTAPELSANGVHHGTFRHEMGDSTLTTERGWQADLNLTYHTETFHFSFTPFYNYFNQFIYLSPTGRFSTLPEGGQVYQHRQDNAIFTGFELSADYHIFKELHFHTGVEYVWNYNLNTRLPLPFTPPFSILGELEYTLPFQSNSFSDAFVGIFAQRFAAQDRVDRNELPTPGYTLFNFSSGFNFRVKEQPFNFLFSIQNLGNTRYLNHLSRYRLLNLPEPGRNFTITLKIPLSVFE